MFSVLIPVFNHARFLRQAVDSAIRDPLVGEVVMIDDGSQDDSPRVIRDLARAYGPRLRPIGDGQNRNRGAHARLNELVDAARYEWVAVLNSDDAFIPSRFTVARPLLASGRTQFVSGHMLIMDANGTVFGHKRGWRDPEYPFPKNLQLNVESAHWHDTAWQEVFRGRLLNQNFIATTSNMMFTKQLHARLGGFRDYRYCHDWDFALRAAFDGDVGWCRQPLTLYRIHGSNTISEAKERIRAEVSRMFERFSDDVHGIEATPISRTGLAANRYLQAA